MGKHVNGNIKTSPALMWITLLTILAVLAVNPPASQAAADQEPGNINWNLIPANQLHVWSAVDANMNHYYVASKFLDATTSLISSHCKTGWGTRLKHFHESGDFVGILVNDANRFWNWYYDQVPGITRLTNATNKTNCLCYAMDPYARNANYDYWVNPGTDANQLGNAMVVDDCDLRASGPPPNPLFAEANDRVGYAEQVSFSYFEHMTIVDTVSSQIPTKIRWKNNASGAYEWNVPGDEPDDDYAFSTPGSNITYLNPLRKNYNRHFYPYWYSVIFYKRR